MFRGVETRQAALNNQDYSGWSLHMEQFLINIFLFGGALLLLITGMPIWAGLAGISVVAILLFSPHILPSLPYVLYSSLDNFALLAIPLFIILSAPISASKASRDLYETLHKWMYKIPGGPGHRQHARLRHLRRPERVEPGYGRRHRRGRHSGNAPQGLLPGPGHRADRPCPAPSAF